MYSSFLVGFVPANGIADRPSLPPSLSRRFAVLPFFFFFFFRHDGETRARRGGLNFDFDEIRIKGGYEILRKTSFSKLLDLDWIWTGRGEGRRGDVCRRKFSEVSVSIGLPARHSAASCQISKRSYSDRFGGRSKKRRAKNFLGKQGEGKSNSFREEGRRKREGRRGNYFNSSRSIARCNFLAFTLGQGEGKKRKKGRKIVVHPPGRAFPTLAAERVGRARRA